MCGIIPASRIASICKLKDNVYIGTVGGLARIEADTLKIEHYKSAEGLTSENILTMAADDRFLWVSTDLGIDRFDTGSGDFLSFGQVYEGAPALCMATEGNYVWIGTTGGLVRLFKLAEPLFRPMLDDFENNTVTQRMWNPKKGVIPYGVEWAASVDAANGANGSKSSLHITYELEPEPTLDSNNYHCFYLPGVIDKDLTPYEGITFFIKVEGPASSLNNIAHLLAKLHESGPVEEFGCHLKPVLGEWARVVIPFTAFSKPPMQSTVNGILELRKVNAVAFEYGFYSWHQGQELTFWIDEISLYKAGEFEPTVPDQKTAVDRQK